jgi:hypothetical protein
MCVESSVNISHGFINRREIVCVKKKKKAKLENDAVSQFGRLCYDVMHIVSVPYDSGHTSPAFSIVS